MKKSNVGATSSRPHFEEITKKSPFNKGAVSGADWGFSNKGITLIALIITIIVMLILVAVSIQIALNTGLFESAGKATKDWEAAQDEEQQLAAGKIKIDEKWYASIDDYIAGNEIKEPLIITAETEGVVYTDKDGNEKQLTEEVEDGDIVQYGDYEYRYNMRREVDNSCIESWWTENTVQNGWGVWLADWSKEKPGEICNEILGLAVNNMNGTFYDSLVKTAPDIPSNIKDMSNAFLNCGLTGTIRINSTDVTCYDKTVLFSTPFALKVQVPANSTTYDTVYEMYGDSENITIETF